MSSLMEYSDRSYREEMARQQEAHPARTVPSVGQRVRTRQDGKSWWTVQAAGSRYAICSRQAPFKPKGDYLYTIMDFEKNIQGPCNLVGQGWDVTQFKTPEIGWRALHLALLGKQVEISHRNNVDLVVVEVQ